MGEKDLVLTVWTDTASREERKMGALSREVAKNKNALILHKFTLDNMLYWSDDLTATEDILSLCAANIWNFEYDGCRISCLGPKGFMEQPEEYLKKGLEKLGYSVEVQLKP